MGGSSNTYWHRLNLKQPWNREWFPSLVSPGHGTAAFGESDYQIAFQVGGARSLWEFVGLSMGWVSRRFLGIFRRDNAIIWWETRRAMPLCVLIHIQVVTTTSSRTLFFWKPSFARKDRYMSLPGTLIRQTNAWFTDSPVFFFRLKLCHLRTQNGGLPGADEVAVWERNIAPMKGETLQRWTHEFQPVSIGFNQNWSVWFLLKETFILGCPPLPGLQGSPTTSSTNKK